MRDFDVRVSWRPASHDQLCEALRRWNGNAAVGEFNSKAHAASVVMHAVARELTLKVRLSRTGLAAAQTLSSH